MPELGIADIANLNGFMREIPDFRIEPQLHEWYTLYDRLRATMSKEQFEGDVATMLVQTDFPFTGQAYGDNIDQPYGEDLGFVTVKIPIKEIIIQHQISRGQMKRATGPPGSFASYMKLVLDAGRMDFNRTMELNALGHGTGALARANGTVDHTTPAYVVITFDNTYADMGPENVQWVKVGQWVEGRTAAGAMIADSAGVARWKVTAVTFGNRANGAATTGTATIKCTSGEEEHIAHHFDDGAVLYRAGTTSLNLTDSPNQVACYEATSMHGSVDIKCPMPMGLFGLYQTATVAAKKLTDGAIDQTLDTFQQLARASYPALNANCFDATDFASGGSRGTPDDFGLSDVMEWMRQSRRVSGEWVTALVTSQELAICINRKNKSEGGVNVVVSSTGATNMTADGGQPADKINRPDGKSIPIITPEDYPRYSMHGINEGALKWWTQGDFDFHRETGDIWGPQRGTRKPIFEAPYGGYSQVGARNIWSGFHAVDLADNV